jgi:hypothetical protein
MNDNDKIWIAVVICAALAVLLMSNVVSKNNSKQTCTFQQLDRSQTSNTLNDFSKTQLENALLPMQSSIALLV